MDRLANLPPLFLTLVLPIGYPMRRPPILKTVHATDGWPSGSVVAPMVKYLQEIWKVLDRHWSAPGRCYAVRFFSQSFTLSLSELLIQPRSRLLQSTTHPLSIGCFSSTTFTCAICFSGSKCIHLSACSHVFSRGYLTDSWSLRVREGDVDKVACADPECVKKESKQQDTNEYTGGVREGCEAGIIGSEMQSPEE